MAGRSNAQELAKELSLKADKRGLMESDVHRMVRDAFRDIDRRYRRRLDSKFDQTYERLRRAKYLQAVGFHIQEKGGDKMKPLKEFAAGSVRATIWENERENGDETYTAFAVQVERTFKDQYDTWQATNRFRRRDLPDLELFVRKAHEFVALREREPQEEGQDESENGEDPEA
jgi:hypothetical protein